MNNKKSQNPEGLLDHYIVLCFVLALFILTLVGIGSILTVGLLGLILCAAGLIQPPARVDLWVLIPLLAYNLMSMVSSFVTYGNIMDGYASTQMIFPVIYLLMACLDGRDLPLLRRLCAVWVVLVAGAGGCRFALNAVTGGSTGRLGGLLGNPNALGIFLVLGWFALADLSGEELWSRLLRRTEPLLLAALALTLSMGSFLAMAGGILALLLAYRKQHSWRETCLYACRILARAGLGFAIGVLMYLAANRTGAPWICLLLLAYTAAAVVCWERFRLFLEQLPWAAVGMTVCAALVALGVILIRPNAAATFTERLEMMANGLGYLAKYPLFGVGPFQWRTMNMYDGDKYFNTYHIHNAFIHVGAEFGLLAMVMLLLVAIRVFRKKKAPFQRAGAAAFFVHCLIDTSFFYVGITSLALMTVSEPRQGGRDLSPLVPRLLFGLCALYFAYDIYGILTVL